jgi:sarcosine oxidase
MKHYDVVVVGLGAIGSAAIYRLSRSGLSVIGIDKYSPPHTLGSSFGESRVTRRALAEDENLMPLIERADILWKELEVLSGEKLYDHCGLLIAGFKEHTFIKESIRIAKKFGVSHELLDEIEVEKKFPAVQAIGKGQVYYYEPNSGYLKPEACIMAELTAAKNNGAELRLYSQVVSINETSNGVKITLGDNNVIHADKIIVASGPWIKQMLHEYLGPVLKTLLQTLYWFDIDKDHYEDLRPGKLPVYLCGDDTTATTRSFYGFPALNGPDGGVKFAVHETEFEVRPDKKNLAKPTTTGEEVFEYVSRYIKYVRPEVLRSANCLYTMTPDENFILDYVPGSSRVVIASACSGHGFKHSSATGEIAVQ